MPTTTHYPKMRANSVDAVRRAIAEDVAKRDEMSVEDALAGVIDLHEAGRPFAVTQALPDASECELNH